MHNNFYRLVSIPERGEHIQPVNVGWGTVAKMIEEGVADSQPRSSELVAMACSLTRSNNRAEIAWGMATLENLPSDSDRGDLVAAAVAAGDAAPVANPKTWMLMLKIFQRHSQAEDVTVRVAVTNAVGHALDCCIDPFIRSCLVSILVQNGGDSVEDVRDSAMQAAKRAIGITSFVKVHLSEEEKIALSAMLRNQPVRGA